MSLSEVDALASDAHAGQVDRAAVPYIEHVRGVAAGLVPFGDHLVMAGLLHDIIEDTDWTTDRLLDAGVPPHVVSVVDAVTNKQDVPYLDMIRRIRDDRDATLVKISDNAHNSRPDRSAQLPDEETRLRLVAKYRSARDLLWPRADSADIEAILTIVNPALLAELGERRAGSPGSKTG
jgi:(p)ppGpp synthase/HD superfamily hydrolase